MSRDEQSIFRFGFPQYRDVMDVYEKKDGYKISNQPQIKEKPQEKPKEKPKEKPQEKKAPIVKAHILELLNSLRK